MADASDSKSDAGDCVWVQVPSPACKKDFIPNGMESFFEAERAMNPGFILRSASVGAKRSSPGRAAPHLLHVRRFMNLGSSHSRKLIQQKFDFTKTCSADSSCTGCILDISYGMSTIPESFFDRSGSDTHTVTDYFFIVHSIPSFRG